MNSNTNSQPSSDIIPDVDSDQTAADILVAIMQQYAELDRDLERLIDACPHFADEINTVLRDRISGVYLETLLDRIRNSSDQVDLGMEF